MKNKNIKKMLGSILLLCSVSNPVSAEIMSFPDANTIDDSYGDAIHTNPKWQQLASSVGGNITDQQGISWSTDNGQTWDRNILQVGDNVVFKMEMFKTSVGRHYADHAKMWLDLDGNGLFSESEAIIYGEQKLLDNENLGTNKSPNVPGYQYLSEAIHIGHEHAGTISLRGRVVCSESLISGIGGQWNDQFKDSYKNTYSSIFTPTRKYYQGESEDWNINVIGTGVNPGGNAGVSVPVPGMLLLFVTGMALFVRRNKNYKNYKNKRVIQNVIHLDL